MNHMLIRTVIAPLCFLLSTGCTQKFKDVNATVKEAALGFEDIQQSPEEIAELPYASTYVRVGEEAQIFMVLAYAEPALHNQNQIQLKWVSADKCVIVTENGRVIKTLKLPKNNLVDITPDKITKDPLSIAGAKPDKQIWSATFDWQPHYRYGYKANILWEWVGDEQIQSDAWKKTVRHYKEVISFPMLDAEYTNHFWLDASTHQVVKSIQHIGPNMPAIAMTILKPFSG